MEYLSWENDKWSVAPHKPDMNENGLSKGIKPDYIKPFQQLFERQNFDKIPICHEWDQKISAFTVKDKTPLPCIDDLLDVLEDGKLFTKMDIIWGYNNICIKEGHEWKATFLMPKGIFEPTIMYFGLCNLPGTFMCMMQTIFHDMIQQQKCAIYMDNLIFKGKTKEELCRNTLEGLEILAKHNLYIKESKCYWEVEEVPVLGHIVGKGWL